MKHILTLLLLMLTTGICAQTNIIEHLQKDNAKGRVRIHQSEQITRLVLGERLVRNASGFNLGIATDETDELVSAPRKFAKKIGYRVQVYVGNNSRQARAEATAVGERIRAEYPELGIYTMFQSPRWLCRVGDFITYEEARLKAQELRKVSGFKEVAVVKDQINVPID